MESRGCIGRLDPSAGSTDGREVLFLELVALPLRQVLACLLAFYFFFIEM